MSGSGDDGGGHGGGPGARGGPRPGEGGDGRDRPAAPGAEEGGERRARPGSGRGPPGEPAEAGAATPDARRPLLRWARSVIAAGLVVLLVAAGAWWFSPALTRWLDGRFPDVLFRVETDRRAVALTIDDSPSPATDEILDVLDRHGARATFFVLGGRVAGREDVLRRAVEEGHELGNHMMEDRPTWRLHPEEMAVRMRAAGRIVARFDTVRWLRPGAGWFDADIVRAASDAGYRVALGSVYPFDVWVPWPGLLAAFLRRQVRPGDVIVLHDGRERGRRTVEVLERALPALRDRGFRVVTLRELARAGGDAGAEPAATRGSPSGGPGEPGDPPPLRAAATRAAAP